MKIKEYNQMKKELIKDDRGDSTGAFINFVREQRALDQEPRTMAHGGRIGYDEGSSYEYKIKEIMGKHPGMTRPLAIRVIEAGISPDDYDAIAGLENKAEGGRIGFFEAGLVKQGPNTGKASIPYFNDGKTAYYKDLETAKKAIELRKEKTSKFKKSRNILSDSKLKKRFINFASKPGISAKDVMNKFDISSTELYTSGLRDILPKDFQLQASKLLKTKTINNMLLLHNHKEAKDFIRKGLIVPDEIIEKIGLNYSEAATATVRLGQHYGGQNFNNKRLNKIRRNTVSSDKLFKALDKFQFGNPYHSKLYRISLETIDGLLGNEKGTFESLKNQARYILKKNNIKGFDINEIAGVRGTAKSGVGEFSQFIDVMERSLNQGEMASFQSAFSQARQNIKDNPKSFAVESKRINKLASKFESEYGVKLPRIRNVADVEKYYTDTRLEELKNQGLDIKKASKKLGYTIEMPRGSITVGEFVEDPGKLFKNKSFVKWIKKFPCMKSDGGTPDIACHLKGMRHEKNLLAEGKGTRAMANKFIDGTKMARKGGALKTIFGLGGLIGDVVFEGAYAAYNYTQGKDAADIWRHSWYSFMDPSMWKDGKYVGWVEDAEKRKQYEIKDEDGNVIGIRKNVKRYYDNVDKVEQHLDLYDNLSSASQQDPTLQVGGEKEAEKKVFKARTELSNFNTRINLEGGMGKIYEELEYDSPYVDTRLEATGAQAEKDKVAAFEKMKAKGWFSKDTEYADRFDKPIHYKKRYDDFLDFRTTIFDRPTEPSFYLPKGKLHQRVEDPRYGVPYATRGGPKAQSDITGAGIEDWLMSQAEQAGEPITREEAVKLKWKLIYEGGGLNLQDKIGIAGGVSKMAGGGMVGIRKPNAIAPTGGPMSQGLRSLYINDKDY